VPGVDHPLHCDERALGGLDGADLVAQVHVAREERDRADAHAVVAEATAEEPFPALRVAW
jgi:hypothetical protein